MNRNRVALLAVVLGASLLLPACSRTANPLEDAARRKEIIATLALNPSMRAEVIDRLLASPDPRAAVIDRVLKDPSAASDLVGKILQQDRGKEIVASRIAADPAAKSFIKILMLTGVMGESMTQQQADAIGLGEPFAYGNQYRTVHDVKAIGALIDAYGKKQAGEDGPRYPVCNDFLEIEGCLAKRLPAGSLAGLRTKDAWGHAIRYHSDREGKGYLLVSYAGDGKYDELGKVGPTQGYDCDIVFSNDGFIQWPGWIRKNELR